MRGTCLRYLAILVLGFISLWTGNTRAQSDSEFSQLERQVRREPRNIDARLQLARWLSWRNERQLARQHALRVIKAAPAYWDAHILVARLDAWNALYSQAITRLLKLLAHVKANNVARILLADVYAWSGKHKEALRIVNELVKTQPNAELYQRIARSELAERRSFAAYQALRKAQALNPSSEALGRLRDSIQLFSVDATYALQSFPRSFPDPLGHSAFLSLTFLPRNRWSISLLETYQYRFGANNNQIGVRGDWRITNTTQLGVMSQFGWPHDSVSKMSSYLGLRFPLYWVFDAALSYTVDLPPWGGHLHRIRSDLGASLGYGFHGDIAYTAGILARCGGSDTRHGLSAGASWAHRSLEIQTRYTFGVELGQPAQVNIDGRRYNREGCALLEGNNDLPASVLESETIGISASYHFGPRFGVRAGYTYEARRDARRAKVHGTHLGIRSSF